MHVERHRLAQGAYPETLAALVPEFVDAVPGDVINGRPLRYLRSERAAFLLYSVGLNGVDDGGYPPDWKTPEGKTRDDWCWVQLTE